MNEIVEQEHIEGIIYEIRGVQVMLDSDLARLYECKNGTKEVNQAVKNNQEKFPERYCFRLNDEECYNLRSKFSSTNINFCLTFLSAKSLKLTFKNSSLLVSFANSFNITSSKCLQLSFNVVPSSILL